jgi:hypothetical protein
MNMKWKTFFPRFDLDVVKATKRSGVPDAYETETCADSVSSDDEESIRQREKVQTKEDQDVAVFIQLAQQLSVKSLVHLMQGSAQAQNLSCHLPIATPIHQDHASSPYKPLPKIKKFRFAEISGGQRIRCIVHTVDSFKDEKHLWWSDAEMREVRAKTIKDIKYYRGHQPEYIQSVEAIVSACSGTMNTTATTAAAIIEEHVKKLLWHHSLARGLETHICSSLSQHRRDAVAAVLEEQTECRRCADSDQVKAESLREQSLAYSQQSRQFSFEMARSVDRVQALQAHMAVWEPELEPARERMNEC